MKINWVIASLLIIGTILFAVGTAGKVTEKRWIDKIDASTKATSTVQLTPNTWVIPLKDGTHMITDFREVSNGLLKQTERKGPSEKDCRAIRGR